MEHTRIENYLNQIIRGYVRFNHLNSWYKLTAPTIESKCEADAIYDDTLELGHFHGLYNDRELTRFLYRAGIWSDDDEDKIEGIKKDIEEFKVKMYQLTLKVNEMEVARKALRIAESALMDLLKRKHSYDFVSARGMAKIARENYLVLSSLKYIDNTPVFSNVVDEPIDILMPLVGYCQKNRISDKDIRAISRADHWRSVWALSKDAATIFNTNIYGLTDEQRTLCAFSKLYDSIYESADCPHESIIDDDDLLDGWLIVQRRNREKEQNIKLVDSKISKNEKIRSADEVYVLTDNIDDAKKIDDMNDVGAKIIKQQRLNMTKKHGIVNEMDMPDVKQRFAMEMQQAALNKLKKGK